MADWFQVDSNLSSKPEVRQIKRATGVDKSTIVGRLVIFWAFLDQHGDLIDEHERADGDDLDGIIPGYTLDDLEDEIGGDRAFWLAVCSTGWLAEDDRGLLVPGFERRFETNAKRRAAAARRQRRKRNRDAGITGASPKRVTTVTAARDESVTRGEERREQKKTEQKKTPPASASGVLRAANSGTAAVAAWLTGEGLIQAIRDRDYGTFERLSLELTGSVELVRGLAAAAYDAREARSPVGVLRWRLDQGLVAAENVSPAAWKWAGELLSRAATKASDADGPCRVCGAAPSDRTGCEACRPALRSGVVRGACEV